MPSANRKTTPVTVERAATSIVEFSPSSDLAATMAVVQQHSAGSAAVS